MEPKTLHAGDSVAWSRDVPEYPPAEGWVLRYVLRGPAAMEIEAHGSGETHEVEIAAAITEGWAAGRYHWAAYVTGTGGERYTIDTGDLVILPNWLTEGPTDVRSHARRMLDLIEAALEKRIPKDQQSYEIDGQRLDRIPVERLIALRNQYRREVRLEERPGSAFGRLIHARM